jgi:hypothetical protein
MLIIGITSLVLVPTLNRVLKPYPALLEKCIRSQLFCLAIGDVRHPPRLISRDDVAPALLILAASLSLSLSPV